MTWWQGPTNTVIHTTAYKIFIVFCTVRILCILNIYGLFHTIFHFDTRTIVYALTISIDCTMHVYAFYSVNFLNTVHDEPKHVAEMNNNYCWHRMAWLHICTLTVDFRIQHTNHLNIPLVIHTLRLLLTAFCDIRTPEINVAFSP